MEGRSRNGGKENEREKVRKEGDDDHEVLKKMIASHPLYGLLIESHFNCLKVSSILSYTTALYTLFFFAFSFFSCVFPVCTLNCEEHQLPYMVFVERTCD